MQVHLICLHMFVSSQLLDGSTWWSLYVALSYKKFGGSYNLFAPSFMVFLESWM